MRQRAPIGHSPRSKLGAPATSTTCPVVNEEGPEAHLTAESLAAHTRHWPPAAPLAGLPPRTHWRGTQAPSRVRISRRRQRQPPGASCEHRRGHQEHDFEQSNPIPFESALAQCHAVPRKTPPVPPGTTIFTTGTTALMQVGAPSPAHGRGERGVRAFSPAQRPQHIKRLDHLVVVLVAQALQRLAQLRLS